MPSIVLLGSKQKGFASFGIALLLATHMLQSSKYFNKVPSSHCFDKQIKQIFISLILLPLVSRLLLCKMASNNF